MDGKGGRDLSSGDGRRRHKTIVKKGRKFTNYLRTHKQALLAGSLLIALVVLLLGVFSHFQGPVTNTPPSGEKVIDYNTFLAQVKTGNMLAVSMRGNDLNGLLVKPL